MYRISLATCLLVWLHLRYPSWKQWNLSDKSRSFLGRHSPFEIRNSRCNIGAYELHVSRNQTVLLRAMKKHPNQFL